MMVKTHKNVFDSGSKRSSRKPNTPTTGKDLAEGLLKKLGFDSSLYGVFEIWDREAETYMKGSSAVAIRGNRIVVRIPSPVHQHEMLFYKGQIIDKVNRVFGRPVIADAEFIHDDRF